MKDDGSLQNQKQPILKNRFVAYAAAVFCTLMWGTAFPFIKLGYSSFEIAESDIGSKLLFAGLVSVTIIAFALVIAIVIMISKQ